MSKIIVDYERLENSKRNTNTATQESASIASKISGISNSLDPRVRGMVSGITDLVSFFEDCADNLSMFYENLDTTIRIIYELENGMEYDYGMEISDLLQKLIGAYKQTMETGNTLQQLQSNEEMLKMVAGAIISLSDEIKNRETTITETQNELNQVISDLFDQGYEIDEIYSNPKYLELEELLKNETSAHQKLQVDLKNLNNLKIVLDYQKQDLEYKKNALLSGDFSENSGYENILNEDGTVNQEVMDAINAYRRENNLVELTEEEFNLIFGETTEEEWLQRAATSPDVFSAVNPLMVASAVNKNGYETGVDMGTYLLADTYLTEEEKATYNYYYNKLGREKADEYLSFKLGELSTRKRNEENRIHQEKYQEYLNLGKNSNYDELSLKYYDHTLNLPEHLTEEERNTAIYLYKTEGLEKYDEFIDFLGNDLKQREARAQADEAIEEFVNSGVFKNVKIGATGLGDGVLNFFEGLINATVIGADGEVSVNQLKSQYILEALMTDSRFTPYLDSGTYEISMGIGNMVPSMAASALVSYISANPALGAKVGTVLMGLSAGGNSYESALMSGSTQAQALLYGILSGSSEATLGYFLGNIPGLSRADSATLLGLLKEGGEEASQEILDSILRNQVLGEELVLDWNNVAKSGLYGMITSGVLEGISVGAKISYKGIEIGIDELNNLIKNLESSSTNTTPNSIETLLEKIYIDKMPQSVEGEGQALEATKSIEELIQPEMTEDSKTSLLGALKNLSEIIVPNFSTSSMLDSVNKLLGGNFKITTSRGAAFNPYGNTLLWDSSKEGHTLFHELGHAIDRAVHGLKRNKKVVPISYTKNESLFIKNMKKNMDALSEIYQKLLEETKKTAEETIRTEQTRAEIEKQFSNFEDSSAISTYLKSLLLSDESIEKYAGLSKEDFIERVLDRKVYLGLFDIGQRNGLSDFSDILSAYNITSLGKENFLFLHSFDYYQKDGKRFAENYTNLFKLKQVFPNVYEALNSILGTEWTEFWENTLGMAEEALKLAESVSDVIPQETLQRYLFDKKMESGDIYFAMEYAKNVGLDISKEQISSAILTLEKIGKFDKALEVAEMFDMEVSQTLVQNASEIYLQNENYENFLSLSKKYNLTHPDLNTIALQYFNDLIEFDTKKAISIAEEYNLSVSYEELIREYTKQIIDYRTKDQSLLSPSEFQYIFDICRNHNLNFLETLQREISDQEKYNETLNKILDSSQGLSLDCLLTILPRDSKIDEFDLDLTEQIMKKDATLITELIKSNFANSKWSYYALSIIDLYIDTGNIPLLLQLSETITDPNWNGKMKDNSRDIINQLEKSEDFINALKISEMYGKKVSNNLLENAFNDYIKNDDYVGAFSLVEKYNNSKLKENLIAIINNADTWNDDMLNIAWKYGLSPFRN